VPAETVRRRYRSGLRNFFELYEKLASTWRVYDSSGREPRLIATRLATRAVKVYDERVWSLVRPSENP
jgi:predicted ABC-type ATPase